jgi:IclR family pca regulon transcriptional regulator
MMGGLTEREGRSAVSVEDTSAIERTSEHVQSLERGLLVIKAFARERQPMTLTEVAARAGLGKAVARRLLMTLESLGYVGRDRRHFFLLPRTLELGYAYLTSIPLTEIVQPRLRTLAAAFDEDASLAILDNDQVVYIARINTGYIITSGLGVGDRVPAHTVSPGLVLLAELPPDELARYFATSVRKKFTDNTVVDEAAMRAELDIVRKQGYAIVDGRLAPNVLTIAVPIRDKSGHAIGAIKIGGRNAKASPGQMTEEFLPALLEQARQVSYDLTLRS